MVGTRACTLWWPGTWPGGQVAGQVLTMRVALMRRLWISSATPSRGWHSYPILARYGYTKNMGLQSTMPHGEADGYCRQLRFFSPFWNARPEALLPIPPSHTCTCTTAALVFGCKEDQRGPARACEGQQGPARTRTRTKEEKERAVRETNSAQRQKGMNEQAWPGHRRVQGSRALASAALARGQNRPGTRGALTLASLAHLALSRPALPWPGDTWGRLGTPDVRVQRGMRW